MLEVVGQEILQLIPTAIMTVLSVTCVDVPTDAETRRLTLGNGHDEPVQFTRGDAERLRTIEVQHKATHKKLDSLTSAFNKFLVAHDTAHDNLNKALEKNTRFRRVTLRILLWTITSGTGLAVLAAGAKTIGWLN